MRVPLSCSAISARLYLLVSAFAIPLILQAQFVGPIHFDTAQNYDESFREDGLYDGITYDPSGYVFLQGSALGVSIYDGPVGNGNGGVEVEDSFEDLTVSSRIGSSNYYPATFRAGYLLRLDEYDTNGYLAQVTAGVNGNSVIFEISEGAGVDQAGDRIFREVVSLDSFFPLEPDVYYSFEVSLVGGTFTMDFANGQATATYTDPSVSANEGRVGILLATANPFVQVNMDNFSVSYPLVQAEMTGSADYGSGAGQSFFLPSGETIYAIELHIERGDGSIEVNLWKTHRQFSDLKRDGDTPEASGTLMKEAVEGMPPGCFSVILDRPYTNYTEVPEELVFDLELLTRGQDGWNDYSFSDQNPYAYGSRVSYRDYSGEYSESPIVDLAFRVITQNIDPPQFSYYENEDGMEIDGYLGSDPDVVFPREINGKPVLAIRNSVFYETAVDIHSVSIPDSVVFIGGQAFELCCNLLASISVSPRNLQYASQDGVLFNKAMTSLLRCPDAKSGAYIIPDSVTAIEGRAFSYSSLIEITIPASVREIGSYCFLGSTTLSSATFEGDAPVSFGSSVFTNVAPDFIVYYNEGAVGFTSPTWNGYPTIALSDSWYAGASNLSDGWRYFDWFKGFKPEGENWIYHGRHGWLYVLADDTSGMFLWDVALGRWMYTNATTYPWMYAYGPNEGWVFFFEGGSPGSRYFKRGDNGQVVSELELSTKP